MLRRLVWAAVLLACVSSGPRVAGQVSLANASRASFDEAVKAATELPRIHSLLVSRRGELVLERYFNGRRATSPGQHQVRLQEHHLRARRHRHRPRAHPRRQASRSATFLPDQFWPAATTRERRITIEDLLTMRSGLESTSNRNYGAWVQSRNWVRYVLTRPLLNEPGTRMRYSTGNTHLLSAILTKATGKSTWQFAQETLAKPLGFTLAQWPRDPQGIYFGGNEMVMTPRQMLAFGELYLNRGRVKGVQIVPETWIDASFIPRGRSDFSEQLYGYGWWIREIAGHQAYYAWGYGGQFIFLVPDLDLVVVSTSSAAVSDERRSHRRTVDDIIEYLIVEPIARQG